MKLPDVRRRRLRRYITERFDGNVSAFAKEIGKAQSQIADMLAGRKSFGEKVARSIEAKLGLDAGYLDSTESKTAGTSELSAPYLPSAHGLSDLSVRVARKWQQLNEPAATQVLMLIETLLALESQHLRQWSAERAAALHRLYEKGFADSLK